METIIDHLFLKLKKKGFMQMEIARLIKDVYYLFEGPRENKLTFVNRSLEELGWGMQAMDHTSYEMIKFLFENNTLFEVEKNLHQRRARHAFQTMTQSNY